MKPKYILHPGPMKSKNDDQWHQIGVGALTKLYGVPLSECLVDDGRTHLHRLYSDEELGQMIHLWPRYDGDYRLPEQS